MFFAVAARGYHILRRRTAVSLGRMDSTGSALRRIVRVIVMAIGRSHRVSEAFLLEIIGGASGPSYSIHQSVLRFSTVPRSAKMTRNQKSMFPIAREITSKGRCTFFDPADDDLPVRQSAELEQDDRVPQFGFVGSQYDGRILIVGDKSRSRQIQRST
jgi:hypothetical protein